MLHFDLPPSVFVGGRRLRVCAVSYLNTEPLVWGLTHGPQSGAFELTFEVPAVCADRLESGDADIGLVPCAELHRLGLDFFPELGIASEGPVRSILLVSKTPIHEIRTLAADISSRTSVALTRLVLREGYGVEPAVEKHAPDLAPMLGRADAALLIGDAALDVDPASLPFTVLDLGQEWTRLTGLPMVYAVWAGRPEVITPGVAAVFEASYQFGLDHFDELVAHNVVSRGYPEPLVREYLSRHIRFRLGERERAGLDRYLAGIEGRRRVTLEESPHDDLATRS